VVNELLSTYKLGFMDATIVYLAAINHFKDLSTLQTYIEKVQDILEQDRDACIIDILNLESFESFEKILCANKLSEEIETKV
jgi:cell division protein ZapA (FtsZ GTPase activity inhibitor)